jgi:hypothetical protein
MMVNFGWKLKTLKNVLRFWTFAISILVHFAMKTKTVIGTLVCSKVVGFLMLHQEVAINIKVRVFKQKINSLLYTIHFRDICQ